MDFKDALKNGDLDSLRKCPKADLHNHFVLGGSRTYLKAETGIDIHPIDNPLHSMDEMHEWNARNLGNHFESPEGRRTLIRATFTQAVDDGVTVLEIGEDVWGLGALYVISGESDEQYANGKWECDEETAYVLHRFCVSPQFQNKG